MLLRGRLSTGVHVLMSKWSEGVRAGEESVLVIGRFLEALEGSRGGGIVRGGFIVLAVCGGLGSGGFDVLCVASGESCG